jgi:DivIVA domain-containing protein
MRKDKVITEVLGEEVAITPSDLCNQQFKKVSFGGYDTNQVDTFLARVADVVEDLISEIRHLKEHYEEQRAELEEYRRSEATLREALSAAQKLSGELVEAAKQEAKNTVDAAHNERDRIQADALVVPQKLSRDIHLMEQQRSRLRAELKAIIETHRRLLDNLIPPDSLGVPSSFFDVAEAEAAGFDRHPPSAEDGGAEPFLAMEGLDQEADEDALPDDLEDADDFDATAEHAEDVVSDDEE